VERQRKSSPFEQETCIVCQVARTTERVAAWRVDNPGRTVAGWTS